MRQINSSYLDPLNIVWTELSKQLGFDIVRDPEVFAAFDGDRVLRIGTSETLDPDDSLGQMVLHELCHALVEGPEAMGTPDWGLDFDNPNHRAHEFAALRLQASFADHVAMRNFFGSTTDFRWYFDLIPNDSLHSRVDPDSVSKAFDSSIFPVPEGDLSLSALESVFADDRSAIEMAQKGRLTAEREKWLEPIMTAVNRTASLAKVVREIATEGSIWKF